MAESSFTAVLFLINTIFDLFTGVLILRLLLIKLSTNLVNPLTFYIIYLTRFIVDPCKKIFPTINKFETASLILILAAGIVKFLIIALLYYGMPDIIGISILSLAYILQMTCEIFFYAILLQALLSWIQPHTPLSLALYQLTWPIMRPFQRLLPLVGGIDLSAIPTMISLRLFSILVITPIFNFGYKLAMS